MKKIDAIDDLRGVRCDVLGIGISNIPLIEVLIDVGAVVTARDKKNRDALGEICQDLEDRGVRLILGEDYLDGIDGEVIFRSPGIRPDAGSIESAVKRGALLCSEMELFLSLTKAKLFAITGSDGKTTTTTLTHLFLEKQLSADGKGRAYVGGNIGTPLLSRCAEMTERDCAVLELSSFQLMTLNDPPKRAAITNITPNHLNWHIDMDEYIEAKKRIISEDGLLVLNAENEITAEIARRHTGKTVLFSSRKDSFDQIAGDSTGNISALFLRDGYIVYSDGTKEENLLKISDIKLPGVHNLENYMTAIGLTYGIVDPSVYTEIAKSFGGVAHRLELVRELDGVRYYNSSIDSSPTRTAAALSALEGEKVVICGGYDKNIPFEPLAEALCAQNVVCVVLTGATAKKIRSAILGYSGYDPEKMKIIEVADFDAAVTAAKESARRGESVLLSPACASFDAFKNFEERGNRFKSIVGGWSSEQDR